MAKTLGQQLDDVQIAIESVLTSQKYAINGRELTRADLSALQIRENDLIKKIEAHGRDYIPGQNARPIKMSANVCFS